MGNRITRAATHVPVNAVQKRMQEERHPWRRKHWEIIYQALTIPRKAEDIAQTVGVSPATVHRVMAPCIACWTGTGGSRWVHRPALLRRRRASPLEETPFQGGSGGSSKPL